MKKILLFGFDTLPEILAVRAAAAPFGAEVAAVGRADRGKPLGVLAGLDDPTAASAAAGTGTGRMLVLCGLEEELDALLPALAKAGAGGCLKAVLTRHNRTWTADRLYGELEREHRAIRRQLGR